MIRLNLEDRSVSMKSQGARVDYNDDWPKDSKPGGEEKTSTSRSSNK